MVADFLAEFTNPMQEANMNEHQKIDAECWTVYVGRSSDKTTNGAGIVLISRLSEEITYALRFEFKATNNIIEYKAVVAGLQHVQR